MNCPLCNVEMNKEPYEEVEIDVCPQCKGVWLDNDELKKVVETKEVTFSIEEIKKTIEETSQEKRNREELMKQLMSFKKDASLEKLNTDELISKFKEKWGDTRTLNCPKCQVPMKEFEYAGSGVMIDKCPKGCGFWLDEGELNKVQIMMEYYEKITNPLPLPQDTKITERRCPYCKEKLVEKEYEGVPIDVCLKCGGVWLDKDELYEIIKRREAKFSEEEKKSVDPEKPIQGTQAELIPEINCPICGALMNRFTYAATSGVVIDRCPQGHGVWLDNGELEKIQIYIEKSEELGEKNYAKYTRILNQVKLECEKRREASIQNIRVSRFQTINRLIRWMARKWD